MYLVQNDDGLCSRTAAAEMERRALLSPLLQAQNTYHFNIF